MSKHNNKILQSDALIAKNSIYNKYMNMYYVAKTINDLSAQVFALECSAVFTVSEEIWPQKKMKEEEVVNFVRDELRSCSDYFPKRVIESIYEAILSYSGVKPEVLAEIENHIGIAGDGSFFGEANALLE